MNTKDLFDYAELAEANYVHFDLLRGNFSDDRVRTALTTKEADGKEYKGEFSATQADDFIAKWQVVSHTPNMDSGFSATLFREKRASWISAAQFDNRLLFGDKRRYFQNSDVSHLMDEMSDYASLIQLRSLAEIAAHSSWK